MALAVGAVRPLRRLSARFDSWATFDPETAVGQRLCGCWCGVCLGQMGVVVQDGSCMFGFAFRDAGLRWATLGFGRPDEALVCAADRFDGEPCRKGEQPHSKPGLSWPIDLGGPTIPGAVKRLLGGPPCIVARMRVATGIKGPYGADTVRSKVGVQWPWRACCHERLQPWANFGLEDMLAR